MPASVWSCATSPLEQRAAKQKSGAEVDVLRGAAATLAMHRPLLLVEVHWLGDSFALFYKERLAPLGYAPETLPGEPFEIPPLKRERFHVALRPR